MDLFFVLSGFLISGLLFNEISMTGKLRPGRFFIRRSFKIYPNFIFFIASTFLVEHVINFNLTAESPPAVDYLKDLLFVHNYLGGRWIITWSLDVEEAFYLLLPAFLLLVISMKKVTIKTLFITYLMLLLFGVAMRQYLNISHPGYNFAVHYGYTHIRLDALFFGVLLSYLYHYQVGFKTFIKRHQSIIVIISIFLIVPNFIFKRELNDWVSVVLLATNPIAFGCLLVVTLNSNFPFVKNRLLAYIGKNSYAIYLWHTFLNGYAMKLCSAADSLIHYFLYLAIYFIGSILLGVIATQLIEIPFLNIRNRFFPARVNAI